MRWAAIFAPLTHPAKSDYAAGTVFRVFLLLAVAFVLIAPSVALPAPPPESNVLALIHIPWQELGYEIVFKGPRPGYRAMTMPAERRIEVYLRPQDEPPLVAYDIAHELGHVIDVTFNTAETRKEWRKLRGIDPETPWFGCSRCSDYNTPAGDFAETFALYLRGPQYFRSRIAARPTAAQLSALARFFPKDFVSTAPGISSSFTPIPR
jgi:hypothetical protein